jgi:hypothetical protein
MGIASLLSYNQPRRCLCAGPDRLVLRFTVMDNSDFSPNRLSISIDSSYLPIILPNQETLQSPQFKQRGSLWPFRFSCTCSCSYTYPTVEGFLLGCASASLCSLDKTAYFLIAAQIARRSEQKQVPTHSGKRSFTAATHHSQSAGETTRLSQGGSITSRLADQGSPHMEVSPFYYSTRHTSALAS